MKTLLFWLLINACWSMDKDVGNVLLSDFITLSFGGWASCVFIWILCAQYNKLLSRITGRNFERPRNARWLCFYFIDIFPPFNVGLPSGMVPTLLYFSIAYSVCHCVYDRMGIGFRHDFCECGVLPKLLGFGVGSWTRFILAAQPHFYSAWS